MLDIGAGFGSFVIAARRLGLEAYGIELSWYETVYAKGRHETDLPGAERNTLFTQGNGLTLPFKDGVFDAITLWNVMEHVPDAKALLTDVKRVLKTGGILYIICPNYFSFRKEAHYQISWPPLLPRILAPWYLRMHGKDPQFFKECIFYRTNWEILSILHNLGLKKRYLDKEIQLVNFDDNFLEYREKIMYPEEVINIRLRKMISIIHFFHLQNIVWAGFLVLLRLQYTGSYIRNAIRLLKLYDPLIKSVGLSARKVKS